MENLEINQTQEPKVSFAYVVKHFEDGSVTVEDANIEGTTRISANEMYADIEDVAKTIGLRRVSDAAYQGVVRFFNEMRNQQEQQ